MKSVGGSKKRAIGAIGGLVLGAAFILLFPDVGLGEQGVRCLGILIGAIVWWVCGVLPEYATGLVMVVLFAVVAGISPWVVAFAMYACISPWFMIYQNSVYLPALYSVDGQMVRHGDVAKYCFVYLAICLVGLVISVPYWQWMGFM